jgi:hypothetical protein
VVGTAISDISVMFGVSGGSSPYTFAASGLPAGITISAAGVISGTPATAASAGTATITVTDAASPTPATASITIAYGAITDGAPPVIPPTGTAPRITGPASMSLTLGYAATSTDAFTVTGTAPVTVSKTSGNAAITWNNTTRKLDIAAGLAIGSYPVTLRASNTAGTFTFTFTLTDEEKTYYLDIPKFAGGTVVAASSTPNPFLAIEGATVTLTCTPDTGYELVSIDAFLYGTTTPVALSGTGLLRTFPMPAHHVSVVAVFRLIDVSNVPIVPTVPTAFTQNGILYISGLEPGQVWSIFSITGSLVYQATASGDKAEVALPGRGVYIVTAGKTVLKVSN